VEHLAQQGLGGGDTPGRGRKCFGMGKGDWFQYKKKKNQLGDRNGGGVGREGSWPVIQPEKGGGRK